MGGGKKQSEEGGHMTSHRGSETRRGEAGRQAGNLSVRDADTGAHTGEAHAVHEHEALVCRETVRLRADLVHPLLARALLAVDEASGEPLEVHLPIQTTDHRPQTTDHG